LFLFNCVVSFLMYLLYFVQFLFLSLV
jgi:hypothetical protein